MAQISANDFVRLMKDVIPIENAFISIWMILCHFHQPIIKYHSKKKYKFNWRTFQFINYYDVDYEEFGINGNNVSYIFRFDHHDNSFHLMSLTDAIYEVMSYEDKLNFIRTVIDKYYTFMSADNNNMNMIKELVKIPNLI